MPSTGRAWGVWGAVVALVLVTGERLAFASDTDGLFTVLFFLFVYPVLFILGLVMHLIAFFCHIYTTRRRVLGALIAIGVLMVLCLFPARLFIAESAALTAGFLFVWIVLAVLPLFQYRSRGTDAVVSPSRKESVRWMALGMAVFFAVMAVILFHPVISHYRTERHNERIVQEHKAWKDAYEKNKAKKQE